MWTKRWLATVVLFVTSLLQLVTANVCGNGSMTVVLQTPADFEIDLGGCTTYIGDIAIAAEWDGPFILENITNITGSFMTGWSNSTNPWREQSPLLTSIEAPDLVSLKVSSYDVLHIYNAPALTAISFPKLELAGEIILALSADVAVALDFTSLANASSLQIYGNVPRIGFPGLTHVKQRLYIASNQSTIDGSDWGPYFPMEIFFPVLAEAGSLYLRGNIAESSFPLLGALDEEVYAFEQFRIRSTGQPLDIDFPVLVNVTSISVSGSVKSVTFPQIQKLTGGFELNPTTNMTWNSFPLRDVNMIRIQGNVTSYDISSITAIDSLSISGNANCTNGDAKWKSLYPLWDPTDYVYLYSSDYSCQRPFVKHKEKKKFPKLAVGLSLGIGLPVMLFLIYAFWHGRHEAKKAEELAKSQLPDYDSEMAARSAGGGEVLPHYEPRTSQERGAQHEGDVELADMTRPSPHPPGYDAAVSSGSENNGPRPAV